MHTAAEMADPLPRGPEPVSAEIIHRLRATSSGQTGSSDGVQVTRDTRHAEARLVIIHPERAHARKDAGRETRNTPLL